MQGAPIPNCPGGTDPCCDLTFDGTGVTAANPLPVALDGGDISIGAVEIKAGTNDNRTDVDLPANITSADLALAVHDAATTGVATNFDDVAVAAVAVSVLAANPARKSAIIQNVGTGPVRVTLDGTAPTATRGLQLQPGQSVSLTQPYVPVLIVRAIREGAVSSSVAVVEVV